MTCTRIRRHLLRSTMSSDSIDRDAIEAAKVRALEIAARLSGRSSSGASPSNNNNNTATATQTNEKKAGGTAPSSSTTTTTTTTTTSSSHHHPFEKKIFVPERENPDINFLGLLIGPKGSTQKMLERESGAKVLIRGRGSHKDKDQYNDDNAEDLHVVITGETQEQVDKASELVSGLLYDREYREKLKMDQLRAVANNRSGLDATSPASAALSPTNGGGGGGGGGGGPYYNGAPGGGGGGGGMPGVGYGERMTKTIYINNSQVGLCIGRGGETIRLIQDQSGAHCQIEKEDQVVNGLRPVIISGTHEQVSIAESEIIRVCETGKSGGGGGQPMMGGGGGGGGHFDQIVITIPNEMVGLLIGRAGETVRGIQQRAGARVQVQRDSDANPATGVREVYITGPPDSVAYCRAEIDRIIAEEQQRLGGGMPMGGGGGGGGYPYGGGGGGQQLTITVPNQCVGIVIGRGGDTIRSIQQRTGARVQISKDTSQPEREVYISGDPHSVDAAQREIRALVDDSMHRDSEHGGRPPRRHDAGAGAGGGGPDSFQQFLGFAQQFAQAQQYAAAYPAQQAAVAPGYAAPGYYGTDAQQPPEKKMRTEGGSGGNDDAGAGAIPPGVDPHQYQSYVQYYVQQGYDLAQSQYYAQVYCQQPPQQPDGASNQQQQQQPPSQK